MNDDARRRLPSVSTLLDHDLVTSLIGKYGHHTVVTAVRETLDRLRAAMSTPEGMPDQDAVAAEVAARLESVERDRVRRVINATGVVLHTNLGRAPLSKAAISAMIDAAGPCTVEYDLATHQRTSRGAYSTAVLAELVGADDALVVNNGAAALVLALAVVAGGRQVVVPRGELIEIGGSFRLPAIIEAAGVGLVEVGTTNRTRIDDYISAMREVPDVAAILRVHPSNFRIEGFTHRPTAAELSAAARNRGRPFLHDVGSGVLHHTLPLPAAPAPEPSMHTAIRDGADLVIASGDKLLGGPQAGLLAGSHELVRGCRLHPLARALRMDKLRLAALEATLDAYRRGRFTDLPTWSMLQAELDDLRERATPLRDAAATAGLTAEITKVDSVVGGGSMPGTTLPSIALTIQDPHGTLAAHLATGDPPTVARIRGGQLLLDLRTVQPDQDRRLAQVLSGASI